MPEVTIPKALKVLTKEVREGLPGDEVVEVYNEVFRKPPPTEEELRQDPAPLIEKLVAYINSGLEGDRLASLWRLVFLYRNVWYNEEDERICYNEPEEEVSTEY